MAGDIIVWGTRPKLKALHPKRGVLLSGYFIYSVRVVCAVKNKIQAKGPTDRETNPHQCYVLKKGNGEVLFF